MLQRKIQSPGPSISGSSASSTSPAVVPPPTAPTTTTTSRPSPPKQRPSRLRRQKRHKKNHVDYLPISYAVPLLLWISLFSIGFLYLKMDNSKIYKTNGWVRRNRPASLPHPILPPSHQESEIQKGSINTNNSSSSRGNELLARGVAGRPMKDTPALVGAQRGHIVCDQNVDELAYWNDPVGVRDWTFESPFRVSPLQEKYITFNKDRGGWNNIRISLENIVVLAAATNRTLVLPAEQQMYLMKKTLKKGTHGFQDFIPINHPNFQHRVRTISMEEFLRRAVVPSPSEPKVQTTTVGGTAPWIHVQDEHLRETIFRTSKECTLRKIADDSCFFIYDFLNQHGYNTTFDQNSCLVFDKDLYESGGSSNSTIQQISSTVAKDRISSICGERPLVFWRKEFDDPMVLHFPADGTDGPHGSGYGRLMLHFYNSMVATDPAVDNFFKRTVRDLIHYHDEVYCMAGKIIHEVKRLGAGSYSSMHIRRGDLQFKEVKISAAEWYNNTKEVWKKGELLYIASDEKNMTFFDDLRKHHPLIFLSNFSNALMSLSNPNYIGMVETIIASEGRAFAGTWFSTFTGYINRVRGYQGKSMKDSWYSYLPRKDRMQTWETPSKTTYAYDYPDGWIGIDADVWPTHDVF